MKVQQIIAILALLAVCLAFDNRRLTDIIWLDGGAIGISKSVFQKTFDFFSYRNNPMISPPPVGIIMSLFTTTCYQAFNIFRNNEMEKKFEKNHNNSEIEEFKASKRKFDKSDAIKEDIQQLSARIEMDFNKLLIEMPYLINVKHIMENMKEDLNIFRQTASRTNLDCLENLNCSTEVRGPLTTRLLDSGSEFRRTLNTFARKYMGSSLLPIFEDILGQGSDIVYIIMKREKLLNESIWNCDNTLSANDAAYSLFKYLLLTIVQSYSMVMSAHIQEFHIAKINNETYPSQWIYSSLDIMREFRRDVIILVQASQITLSHISRDIRRCDPKIQEKGVTYDQFTTFLYTQLFSQELKHVSKTSAILDYYQCHTIMEIISFEERNLLLMKNDSNKMIDSDFLWKENCVSNITQVTLGDIRPHNIEYRIGGCNISSCLVQKRDSVRTVCLDAVHASSGYVVTGIKWVIKNRILHLQIQEGKFENGFVDPETVKWVPIPEEVEKFHYIDQSTKIHLNDYLIPPKSYVTGVQFTVLGSEFLLDVSCRQLDKTGKNLKLVPYPTDLRYSTDEIKFSDNSPPHFAPTGIQSRVISTRNKNYITFQPTPYKIDLAQSVVPFFDIQEVVTNPPSPIGGIGLYVKGIDKYGGYLALKIISTDHTYAMKLDDFEEYFNQFETWLKRWLYHES